MSCVVLLCVLSPSALSTGASAQTLPDNRAYELVSPLNQQGNAYDPARGSEPKEDIGTELAFRASAEGDAVAYLGDPPSSGGNGSTGVGQGNQYLATRGSGGWTATDISPSAQNHDFYQAFSSDLSLAFLAQPNTEPEPLTPEVPTGRDVLYSRTSSDGSFHPFFTTASLPLNVEFFATGGSLLPEVEPLVFGGASAGGTHSLFEADAALTPTAKENPPVEEHNDLYDSVGGQLHLVNVLPNGKPDPNAVFGGPSPEPLSLPDFANDISADGSRIFWTDLSTEVTGENPAGVARLFLRQNDTRPQSPLSGEECTVPADACTVELDAVQGGSGTRGGGRFWTASLDGTKVFFTDCSRLTKDSTAVAGGAGCLHEEASEGQTKAVFTGNELYEYDVTKPAGARLSDLTIDHQGDPLGADVQGVIGSSEDGSYVYFVAGGALAPGATARTCKQSETEEGRKEEERGVLPAGTGCNLYVFHRGEPEATKFIKALAAGDNNIAGAPNLTGRLGDWQAGLANRTAEVTPDGRRLLFSSRLRLTGYDNRGLSERPGIPEVFVYNADSAQVSCASCNPSGEPPTENLAGADAAQLYEFGAFVPASQHSTYLPRWISEDGSRVFFDTGQPLVPQDSNGRQDVYEWEREGTAACPAKTPARVNGGCVYLLSGGSSSDNSFLVDASATGKDVFFTTRAELLPQDHTSKIKLYDVRENGGFPEVSLTCPVGGCQGAPPPRPASLGTPPSVTFDGLGNFPAPPGSKPHVETRAQKLAKALRACKKRPKRKRAACEKQARKKYGSTAKKATKATDHSRRK